MYASSLFCKAKIILIHISPVWPSRNAAKVQMKIIYNFSYEMCHSVTSWMLFDLAEKAPKQYVRGLRNG